MSDWIVRNKRNENLVFDKTLKDEPVDLVLKNELLDRYFQYGGIAQGDGKYSTRKMIFKFDLVYKDAKNFRYRLNVISAFFNIVDEPFYLVNLDYNVRCQTRLSKLKPNYRQGLEQLVSLDTEMELDNLDGIFETNGALESNQLGLSNNNSFDLAISQEAIEASGTFEITTSTGCSEFALINETTGDNFQIVESGFIAGSTIIIDNDIGTCYLNGSQKPLMMAAGSFMKFRNGTNTITFQTPTVGIIDLKITYRESFSF